MSSWCFSLPAALLGLLLLPYSDDWYRLFLPSCSMFPLGCLCYWPDLVLVFGVFWSWSLWFSGLVVCPVIDNDGSWWSATVRYRRYIKLFALIGFSSSVYFATRLRYYFSNLVESRSSHIISVVTTQAMNHSFSTPVYSNHMLISTFTGMYWRKGRCKRSPISHQEGCLIQMLP
jgi:hypothetical protein